LRLTHWAHLPQGAALSAELCCGLRYALYRRL
jgi:hypothetical protein